MTRAYICVGSNIEPRLDYIRQAGKGLSRLPGQVVAWSSVYDTEAVGYPIQPAFLNAVAVLETPSSPEELLEQLQRLEQEAHKQEEFRWGPRTLDLDLLLAGTEIRQVSRLALPHPRMHERGFVLRPLCEVDPQAVHPVLNKTAAELLRALPQPQPRVEKVAGPEDWKA